VSSQADMLRCTSCGCDNPMDSRFCNGCGVRLQPAPGREARTVDGAERIERLAAEVRRLAQVVSRHEMLLRSAAKMPSVPAAAPRSFGFPRCSLDVRSSLDLRALGALAATLLLLLALALAGPSRWEQALGGLRQQLNRAPLLAGLVAAGGLAVACLWLRLRPPAGAHGATRHRVSVLLALALAALGQGLLLAGDMIAGAGLHLTAMVVAWRAARRSDWDGAGVVPVLRSEPLLALLVLGVGAFTRLYLVGDYPYGYEGDEAKWTRSIVQYMMAGEPVWPAVSESRRAPLTYWLEPPWFRLVGTSMTAARLQVALFSIVANAAFYLFARRVAGVPVALIATFLLGVSIVDVSASRLANVESHIKIWTILASLSLLWAVDSQRPLAFLLCGLTVAAGLVTYDTFDPISAVVGLYLLVSVARKPGAWRAYVVGGALFGGAVLLAVPTTLEGIRIRHGEYTGVWHSQRLEVAGLPASLQSIANFLAVNLGDLLLTLFVRQRWNDFLVNRDGPLLNAVLLPFFVVGVAVILARIREGHYGLVMLWALLAFVPAAVVLGAVWVRVLYPAMPALYLITALGIWWAYVTARSAAPEGWRLAMVGGLGGFLVVIGVFNTFIYFREVRDFDDRRHRRELADHVAAAVAPGRMTYVVYEPKRGDALEVEQPFAQFVVRGKVGIHADAEYFQGLSYGELLERISRDRGRFREINFIVDGPRRDLGADRMAVLRAVQRCFPGTESVQGQYVATYTVPSTALADPACTSDARARLVNPVAGSTLRAGEPIEFAWEVDEGRPPTVQLEVQRRNELLVHIEAEDAFRAPGWLKESIHVGDFSGSGFLADEYRAQSTGHMALLPAPDTYEVWVRSYRRVADDTHVFLDLAGRRHEVAPPDSGRLNQWVWESMGRHELPAGPIPLTLSKEYGGARHMSLFIDAVILSRDSTFDARRGSIWDIVVDAGPLPADRGTFSSEFWRASAGEHRWRLRLFDGDRLVDPFGRPGLATAYQQFRVAP